MANPGSSAIGNRNYFENTGVASAHYIIDISGAIIRCIPDTEVAWHAGKSFGAQWNVMAATNNSRFIGIECCHPDATGKFSSDTYTALTELCVMLCKKYGLNSDKDIYRHYDVCGKNCPVYYVNNPAAWSKLKNDITAAASTPVHKTTIGNKPTVTVGQMKTWARANNAAEFFVNLADIFYDITKTVAVDPAVAYCQSAKETRFGKFGGILNETFCNPCGMKTKYGGSDTDPEAHQRFFSWSDGISAQFDHLALYAGLSGYPKTVTTDPRHFPDIKGTAPTVEELGGRWAPSKTYGIEIVSLMRALQATKDETTASLSVTVDRPDPSPWAEKAWVWAKRHGITDGTRPCDTATREMVATMIYNAILAPGIDFMSEAGSMQGKSS